jgi:DNA-directed RNA polymerase specialized sigma24 family protein
MKDDGTTREVWSHPDDSCASSASRAKRNPLLSANVTLSPSTLMMIPLISEKWRLPLILCYLEGRTQEEVAAQLGVSKATLREVQ